MRSLLIVARMMLVVRRPFHLKPGEAELWLRDAIAPLLEVDGIAHVRVSRLGSAAGRWNGELDWMIELELADGADPAAIVRADTCAGLLGDLRLLGMRPAVSMVEDAWEAGR